METKFEVIMAMESRLTDLRIGLESRLIDPFGIPSSCVSYHPGLVSQDFHVAPISHFIPLLSTLFHWARVFHRNPRFLLEKLNILYICIFRSGHLESQSLSRPVAYLFSMSLYAVLTHCLYLRDGTSYGMGFY